MGKLKGDQSLLTLLIIVVLIVIIVMVSINHSQFGIGHFRSGFIRRRMNRDSELDYDSEEEEKSRPRKPKRKDKGNVKFVCLDLKIAPNFTPVNDGVDINLDIQGGIRPYNIRWEDGSRGPTYDGADYDQIITVTITDARGCITTKKIQTPPNYEN